MRHSVVPLVFAVWHGNVRFLLGDDALNARNAFAGNKPSYRERRLGVDVSGPIIRGRLSSSFAGTQNETRNVDTVHATLPEGVFSIGITRPNVFRQVDSRTTIQLADAHPLTAFGRPPNSLRGPRYFNVDFSVSKAFFLRRSGRSASGMNANVFANLTNAFNRVHYGTPSGVMTSPNFGRSTSAQDPREIQVGVRFQF